MQSWINALLVPFQGEEGMRPDEIPSSTQVAIVYSAVTLVVSKLLS